MSTNDIMKFSLLPEQEKRESIAGLRDIICGIRIFNKDAGHCGEGLIDSELCNVLDVRSSTIY